MITDVSIVIPSYKAEKLVPRTIESLLRAQVLPQNIFVVEDGIFDQTSEVIKKFTGINHIQLKKNKGAPNARNEGLKHVKTKFVMFIDSDDYVSDDLITGLVDSAVKNVSDITFGPWKFAGKNVKDQSIIFPTELSSEEWVTRWLNTEFIPPCAVMWSTDFVVKIGKWNTSLKQNQDGELAIRGLMNTKNISFSKQGYGVYWQHSSPYRVSRAPFKNRLFAANIIFNQVDKWIYKNNINDQAKKRLGAYCIKQYWDCIANKIEKNQTQCWKDRALNLGYKKAGYNKKTNLIASIFGIRLSLIIRDKVNKRFR